MNKVRITVVALLILLIPIPAHANSEIYVPQLVRDSCDKYGEEYNICSEILQSICWTESRFTARASNGNCKGMCQINIGYQKSRMEKLGIEDIYIADQNIRLCADILYEFLQENDDIELALMKYNCGEQRAKELYQQGIITSYAKNVTELSEQLERQHGK